MNDVYPGILCRIKESLIINDHKTLIKNDLCFIVGQYSKFHIHDKRIREIILFIDNSGIHKMSIFFDDVVELVFENVTT